MSYVEPELVITDWKFRNTWIASFAKPTVRIPVIALEKRDSMFSSNHLSIEDAKELRDWLMRVLPP